MTDDLESIACKGILRFRDDVMGALSCYLNASGKAFTMSFKFADIAIMGIDSGDRRIQNVLNNDHNMYIRLRGPNPFIVLSFRRSFSTGQNIYFPADSCIKDAR